ncbi:hypothetical protein PG988_006530 [Apiospora saccharicola]
MVYGFIQTFAVTNSSSDSTPCSSTISFDGLYQDDSWEISSPGSPPTSPVEPTLSGLDFRPQPLSLDDVMEAFDAQARTPRPGDSSLARSTTNLPEVIDLTMSDDERGGNLELQPVKPLKKPASIRSTQAAMQTQLCRLLNKSNSRDTSDSTPCSSTPCSSTISFDGLYQDNSWEISSPGSPPTSPVEPTLSDLDFCPQPLSLDDVMEAFDAQARTPRPGDSSLARSTTNLPEVIDLTMSDDERGGNLELQPAKQLKKPASIRSTQAAMQTQLCRHLNKSNSRDTSDSIKRKQYDSPSPPRKRQRKAREVNIRATRAWLQFDDEPKPWEYIWRNGRNGHTGCWMSNARHGNEQIDGEHLLSYGAGLSVELRANGDWLPVTVQLNERTDRFEGTDVLDSKIYEIDGTTMLNVMCGGVVGNCGRVS